MVEFLAFWLICGLITNVVAIFRFGANPPGAEVIGATLMWPLVLLMLINSLLTGGNSNNDGHE